MLRKLRHIHILVAHFSFLQARTRRPKAFRRRMPASENIGQFERNPLLETTTRARLNLKHVDVRIGIVKVAVYKISQTVCRWHVSRFDRVRPDTGKGLGRVSREKLSKKAIIIIPNLLYQMIWLGICVEKKDSTHCGKRVCLSWGGFSNSYITIQMHVWNLGVLHEGSESTGRLM